MKAPGGFRLAGVDPPASCHDLHRVFGCSGRYFWEALPTAVGHGRPAEGQRVCCVMVNARGGISMTVFIGVGARGETKGRCVEERACVVAGPPPCRRRFVTARGLLSLCAEGRTAKAWKQSSLAELPDRQPPPGGRRGQPLRRLQTKDEVVAGGPGTGLARPTPPDDTSSGLQLVVPTCSKCTVTRTAISPWLGKKDVWTCERRLPARPLLAAARCHV